MSKAIERETCPLCGVTRKTSERGVWIGDGLERQFHHGRCLCARVAELERENERLRQCKEATIESASCPGCVALAAVARELMQWHDEELPKINGHLTTVQIRAGRSFEGEWEPCGEIVERLRALLKGVK
jgi:hypothetical protein